MHKACRDQAIPLTVIKKDSRQKHVVLKSIDSSDLTPYKQPEIDRDNGVADDKRIVAWSVVVALNWFVGCGLAHERFARERPRWWWW